MPSRRRSTGAACVVLAASLSVAACGTSPPATGSQAGDMVKIAVEGPMTGPQSSTGIDMWRGAALVADMVNSSGGLLGKHLELVKVDDKADPTIAASVARHAVAEHVVGVVGPYNSAVGIVNLPVYLAAHVLVVRLTSNSKTNGMGITLQPMDYQVAPFEASAVEKMAGSKKVAIVYDSSAYTSGVAAQMRGLLGAAGISVVSFEEISGTDTQFTDVLTRVKAAQPTLVYFVAYDPQAEDLVQQASALGVPGTCLVDGLAAEGPTFLKTVPLALARKCVFSGVPTAPQFPDAGSYISAYRAAYHEDPGTWGVFAYDSLGVLVKEIEAAHSSSFATVNTALFHVSGYAGATGSTSIDPGTGNRLDPPLVMQIVDSSGSYVVSPDWQQRGALPVLPGL